jgi:hypothetical protein
MNAEMPILQLLHDHGPKTANRWLQQQSVDLGGKSTLGPAPVFFSGQA